MTRKHKLSNPPPSPSPSSEFEQSQPLSEIDSAEISRTLRTLKKIHKKRKMYHLHEIKGKPAGNKLFFSMSKLFISRHKIAKEAMAKEEREERKERKKQEATRTGRYSKARVLKFQEQKAHLAEEMARKEEEGEQQIINGQSAEEFEEEAAAAAPRCYVCRAKNVPMHTFYVKMCEECGQFNLRKRTQCADLNGFVALVTGSRIKIGYEISLKLLKDGATVVATSRFSKDAFLRFQKQPTFEEWKHRLHIFQCDFVSAEQVNQLISYVKTTFPKLDILINNAAQTLVRPKQFYTSELLHQQSPLSLDLGRPEACTHIQVMNGSNSTLYPSLFANPDVENSTDLLRRDQFGQPLDARHKNSWVQKIEDVSLTDCYTTQLINSIVPFHLISQLKSHMIKDTPSYIVNVSSMEGVFYRAFKQEFHPHTNMAKAALNMITRTSAKDFANSKIYMNSVDTGWVTNMNPLKTVELMNEAGFVLPLDCLDGAMRVIDPVYMGVRDKHFLFGHFLKDYKQSLF